ncbi:MAG: phosphatase PAP2 family protein [Nanoarchaeota archaeon]|nr:phosphatase PAP2 family protein [Nanoarchaeota archaeon]
MKKQKKRVKKELFSSRKIIISAVIAIVFVLSFFLDEYILVYTSSIQNQLFMDVMEVISHFGSILIVLLIMTTALMRKDRKYIPWLWGCVITAMLAVFLLKLGVARPRPLDQLFLEFGLISYSFPSGHTALAFSVLPVLDRALPRLKSVWIIYAVLVGLSRIFIQAHYLSDVIFGAVLGYGVAALLLPRKV